MNTQSEELETTRTCADCRFAYYGDAGCYCVAYGEFVDDEIKAAADCPLYERPGPS